MCRPLRRIQCGIRGVPSADCLTGSMSAVISGGHLPEFENPYAAPTAEILIPDDFGKLRRDGRYLVVPNKWRTPPICLFTGDTHDLTQLRRAQLTWINPWFSWLLLAGIATNFIVGLCLQKHGRQTLHEGGAQLAAFLLPPSQIFLCLRTGYFRGLLGFGCSARRLQPHGAD